MILVFSWIILAGLVAAIASSRGQSAGGYFVLSLVLSPLIAGIAVFAIKPTREEAERSAMRGGDIKRCPHCAELVKREAVICKHCHQAIPVNTPVIAAPVPVPAISRHVRQSEAWTLTSGALAAVVVVLLVVVVVMEFAH